MTKQGKTTAIAIPGLGHLLHDGKVCQDVAGCWQGENAYILAVADGHGGEKYTHSHVGARIAVDTFIEQGRSFIAALRKVNQKSVPTMYQRCQSEKQRFANRIMATWRKRVKLHDQMLADCKREQPLPLDIADQDGQWDERIRKYGTTLLGVLYFDDVVLYFQRGDGAIIIANQQNSEWVFPLSNDPEKLYSSATISMATKAHILSRSRDEKGQSFITLSYQQSLNHIEVQHVKDPKPKHLIPEFILVCTDGVIDGYLEKDNRAQQQKEEYESSRIWGRNCIKDLSSRYRSTEDSWAAWLSKVNQDLWDVTCTFTGDDASIAALWLYDSKKEVVEEPQTFGAPKRLKKIRRIKK